MYLLYAENAAILNDRSRLYDQFMEPLLHNLEAIKQAGKLPASLPEIEQYLQVCRWPFRKLEYSFALDALLEHLQPGDRYLDAGSGVTPLGHVLAKRGVSVNACDGDQRQIDELRAFKPEQVYGSHVDYACEDLTRLTYADQSFDAISCISVIEHIPAPYDQKAIREMLRVLKPGGILVLTLDFTPFAAAVRPATNRLGYLLQRGGDLARSGNFRAIGQGLGRKLRAQQAVRQGTVRKARSANQCFEVEHLEQDILPVLAGEQLTSRLPFATDLRSLTPEHARRFWDLEPGLYDNQGCRSVLPAACILRKEGVVELVAV